VDGGLGTPRAGLRHGALDDEYVGIRVSFAAGVALALFDTHAAVPSTTKSIVMLSHVLVLDLQQRRGPKHKIN